LNTLTTNSFDALQRSLCRNTFDRKGFCHQIPEQNIELLLPIRPRVIIGLADVVRKDECFRGNIDIGLIFPNTGGYGTISSEKDSYLPVVPNISTLLINVLEDQLNFTLRNYKKCLSVEEWIATMARLSYQGQKKQFVDLNVFDDFNFSMLPIKFPRPGVERSLDDYRNGFIENLRYLPVGWRL